MANIKSQKKRVLTNEKARQRNQAVKSDLKTSIKKVRKAVSAGDKDTALAAQRVAARKLDKAASKRVIHKNQAANRKAGLAAKVNSL
ncbi:30S ribosomal protein S20 [Nesterenkonia halophila]|uniref:Small ribosomal subunit protein bS20 n=1 Tax=Nesterenkonia halobia TaxID=37922 RepID=A0ABP6RKS5_9MICC|nr:30S ribosomal protein S20 [Nesterenkonia halophila]